jgi:multidrug efflux pump subunit AcrA (membrane-fusion protein)
VVAVIAIAAISSQWWWSKIRPLIAGQTSSALTSDEHGHQTDGHEHGHAGHEEMTSLELTPQAMKNLGLGPESLKPITLSNYHRSISVPAIITARPGRTQIQVSSPLSGVVTHVHAVTGEAVTPGELLFEVRLTYEDLVDTQSQFLKTISELEVENREIARLEQVTLSGALSDKPLLERRYAKDKLEAALNSQREALRLHGLSVDQIDRIQSQRRLLRDLKIFAPDIDQHSENEELHLTSTRLRSISYQADEHEQSHSGRPLIVEELRVQKGQGVTAGEMLCKLSDFSQLYIEGQAFEQDGPAVVNAALEKWPIRAILSTPAGDQILNDLKLAFVGNSVNEASRTLSFYVELPNEILRDEVNNSGQRFLSWKYRPGQRLQLQVPVESWQDQIVVPVDAVAKEGAEWFVFQRNGDHFDRVPVHVRHRDQASVVIANDGAIYPGDVIALKSAHQMQIALKNKSGGGVDPHAGHHH